MKILLSNDDGYDAEGLLVLHRAIADLGEVTVVAPEHNRSGCSSALSLRQPIKVRTHENGFYSVDGTPADCVHLAVTGLLNFEPDIVISGINDGPNLGDDTIYSGTVAAAIEGRFLAYPGLAISLAGHHLDHYDAAAQVAVDLLQMLRDGADTLDTLKDVPVLNVNVPDLPYKQIRGIEVTRLGSRFQSQSVINDDAQNGDNVYWIGPPGPRNECGKGTDFDAIAKNRVSITPITLDMTDFAQMHAVDQWVDSASKKFSN